MIEKAKFREFNDVQRIGLPVTYHNESLMQSFQNMHWTNNYSLVKRADLKNQVKNTRIKQQMLRIKYLKKALTKLNCTIHWNEIARYGKNNNTFVS